MRRLRIFLIAICLAAAFPVIEAAPAAASPPGGCGTSGYFCAYKDTYYRNGPWRWANSNTNWHQWSIADHDSSWYNYQSSAVRVWVNINWGGAQEICIGPWVGDAAAVLQDDRGSSHLETGGC
jgi:Peptidase inhibitor family I36